MSEKKELEFQKLKICILTISSSRELSDDKSGDVLEERVLGFGHELFERKITKDNKDSIKDIIINWSKNKERTIKRSKAVGEPPLMLAISVHEALSMAASYSNTNKVRPTLNSPATPERILECMESVRTESLE